MTDILSKLSALTGPDREVEEAIYAALGNCNHKRYECYRVQGDSGQTCLDCDKDLYGADSAPRYTASIDAAMTLVPEGCGAAIFRAKVGGASRAELENLDGHEFFADAATPAIALCIAAIQARNLP